MKNKIIIHIYSNKNVRYFYNILNLKTYALGCMKLFSLLVTTNLRNTSVIKTFLRDCSDFLAMSLIR